MLRDHDAAALAEALRSAPYTVDAVAALIGPDAHRALLRNETTAARRATGDGSALATLTRMFALQLPVALADAERALPGLVDPLTVAGVLERSVGEVAARVDLRAYGDEEHDWWVVCDLTPGLDGTPRTVGPEHVLGISEASTSLAQLTVREPVASALDLGAGCGVQSLHLATHAQRVVATDVNPRALWMARLTAQINASAYEVRDGSLFEPVRGERFDLIATNPPFVVSPATGERLVYRDSGLPGDEVVRRIVTQAPDHLNPGGWCQVLANWVHDADRPWTERLADWLAPTGCDAWVLQREVADLPTYVEMWLADAGLQGAPDYVERYDTWLSWFDQQGIEAIGFGWLSLRNSGRDEPVLRLEEWPYEIEQPIGPHVAAWGARSDAYGDLGDDALLATHLTQADGLVQETAGPAGAADPEVIILRLQRGVRRARQVDTVEAGLVGACDGDLSVGQILDALATLLEQDPTQVRAQTLPAVRELVADGFLH
ncbi:methyltransferase family protein [Mumia flava]|uniref:Methyltransferase family protein n=1 Tax=Mumia flava TaxID=1348852 RepID=A0A0B2BJN2_9ACTN|nr:methyltransferase [Mumia flava]PJJ57357.1 methyltransferase family protein [Mumia flava]